MINLMPYFLIGFPVLGMIIFDSCVLSKKPNRVKWWIKDHDIDLKQFDLFVVSNLVVLFGSFFAGFFVGGLIQGLIELFMWDFSNIAFLPLFLLGLYILYLIKKGLHKIYLKNN